MQTAAPLPPPTVRYTCSNLAAKPARSSPDPAQRALSAPAPPARGSPGVRAPAAENPPRDRATAAPPARWRGRSPVLARPRDRFAPDIASPVSRNVPPRSMARGSAASRRPTPLGSSPSHPPRTRLARTSPNSRSLPCCGARPARTACIPTFRRAAPGLACCGNSPPRRRPPSRSRDRGSNTGPRFLDAQRCCRAARVQSVPRISPRILAKGNMQLPSFQGAEVYFFRLVFA